MLTVHHLVLLAGLLHFCQVPAMMVLPRMFEWERDLGQLKPMNRRYVQVVGLAVMLAVLGLGVVVLIAPGEVAGASRLGVALAGFLTIFWGYRAVIQVLVYRHIWPGGLRGRLTHFGLCVLFTFLAVAYAVAFANGLSAA